MRRFAPLCWLVILLLVSGCGSSGALQHGELAEASQVERALRSETRQWEGTPHRLGGVDRRGVDCSAFVQAVYRDALALSLPRTTIDQVETGQRIARRRLAPGDLVFFRLSGKTRHVGIYLSDGEFAHASSSQGVTISHLDQAYWQRHYWTARRVLDHRTASYARSDPPPARPPSSSSPQAGRTGW